MGHSLSWVARRFVSLVVAARTLFDPVLVQVSVYRKPVIAIMSTGNELVDIQGSPSSDTQSSGENWTGIWDTNRPSLQAALETMGYEVIDLGIIQDRCVEYLSYG